MGVEVLFTDPKISFAARINVFADNGSGVLDSLSRYLHSLDCSGRNVDVQKCAYRQPFFQNLPRSDYGERSRLSEIKIVSGNKTQRNAGNPKNSCFQSACDCT